jgi:hypothetical protein
MEHPSRMLQNSVYEAMFFRMGIATPPCPLAIKNVPLETSPFA